MKPPLVMPLWQAPCWPVQFPIVFRGFKANVPICVTPILVAMNVYTPKGITATPAECKDDVKGAINLNLDWIADTGSAQDLVNDRELPDDYGYYSDNPIRMITANGESSSSKQGRVFAPKLGKTIDPYLVRSSPPVISVEMRCVEDGYDFVWRGSKGESPYMVKPSGERVELVIRDYVPY